MRHCERIRIRCYSNK